MKQTLIRKLLTMLCGVFLPLLLSACSFLHNQHRSDLQLIYTKTAQYHKPDRNPIIVIPGILGSKLKDRDTGQTVWGAFNGVALDPNSINGTRTIALPLSENSNLEELQDNVEPNGVLESVRVKLFGIPLNIQAYASILSTLGVGGYRDDSIGLSGLDYGDDHFTCFQFAYDWRRDNVENAKRLKTFIDEKRLYVQGQYKEKYGIENAEIKFDIVAHSMGGLVARYFMRYGDADLPANDVMPEVTWAGTEDVDRLIMVGTPNAGSVDAFSDLINGYDAGLFLPHYESGLLGTFPAIYQLLPRPRHKAIVWKNNTDEAVDLYDHTLWEKYQWGLAANDKTTTKFLKTVLPKVRTNQERKHIALTLQKNILKRAELFHKAIDSPAKTPDGVDLFLVLGDAEKTNSKIEIDKKTGEFRISDSAPGDGTVLRSSALMDERLGNEWEPTLKTPIDWTSVLFLFSDHLGLTRDSAFSDNVLYWLLEEPRD